MVVDGQQRLRTILEFVDDAFKISRAHNADLANYQFSDLPKPARDDFYTYNIGVDLIYSLPYIDILDIFTRINSYTVSLNRQEKLNATFVGYFKTHAYALGHRYAEFWVNSKVLRDDQVARMAEAELASDLLICVLDKVQTSKVIPSFYRDFEDKGDGLNTAEKTFDRVMSLVGDVYSADTLASTVWRRLPLFYSLFSVLGHSIASVQPLAENLRVKISKKEVPVVRSCLNEMSAELDELDPENPSKNTDSALVKFAEYAARRSADTAARVYRAQYICRRLKAALK